MMHQPCDIEDQLVFYGAMDVAPGTVGITYIDSDSPLNKNAEFCQGDIIYAKLLSMYLVSWLQAILLRNNPRVAAIMEVETLKEIGYAFN